MTLGERVMRRLFVVLVIALLVAPSSTFGKEGKQCKKNKDLKGKPKVTAGVNIHSLWSYSDGEESPSNQFSIPMARLEVKFKQGKTIDAKLQGDFEQLFGKGDPDAMLRDAWVRVRPTKWLGFKVGQHKLPFSRVQLRSRSKFETISRGPADDWLVEELSYGERDIGATLSFDFEWDEGRELAISVGGFNGTGRNAPETDLNGAKDVVGRIEGRPVEWFSLGASGALKLFDRVDSDVRPDQAWATGVDLQVDWEGLLVVAEGLFGENWDPCLFAPEVHETCVLLQPTGSTPNPSYPAATLVPKTWSAVLMLAYKIPVYKAWKISLQPGLKGEYFAPDADVDDGAVMAATLGVNLWIGKHFRFMVQGETVRPGDGAPALWQEENRLMTQVAFDL